MSSHHDDDLPNLWPPVNLQITEDVTLKHYDVFISFSGRGTMKGIANAIQETIRSSYETKSTSPSVFNEDIQFHIQDTVAKAVHGTHSGLAVLLINQRYVIRRWPVAEARVLAAMWLSKRITLIPVVVLPVNIPKDAESLWKQFVQAMNLKPAYADRLEEYKYLTLMAPNCNIDFEQEPVPINELQLPLQDDYEELKQVLLGELDRRAWTILGSSRENALFDMLNAVSDVNEIMDQSMLPQQLGLGDANMLSRRNMLLVAYSKGTITETNIDKLETICNHNRSMKGMLKQYKRKYLELRLEKPGDRFLDENRTAENDSLGGSFASVALEESSPRGNLRAIFANQKRAESALLPNQSAASFSGSFRKSVGSGSSIRSSQQSVRYTLNASDNVHSINDIQFDRNMSSWSGLGSTTSSLSTYSSPATKHGLYEMLNDQVRVSRSAAVGRVQDMVEKFGMCYVYGRSGAGKSVVVDSVVKDMNPKRRPWIAEFGDLSKEHSWNDFAKSFASTWDQEAKNDENLPRLSATALPNVKSFCTFINKHLDVLILDNLQRVESSGLAKDLRTMVMEKRDKQGCRLLLISQNPPVGAFPNETECSVNIEGLGSEDTVQLFRILRRKNPLPDEQRCLEQARKSVGGHISLLRHIISQDGFLDRLAKDSKYTRQLPTISLDLLYDNMYWPEISADSIRVFLMHVAFIRLRFPMRFFLSLASDLDIKQYVVEVLLSWSWLNIIDKDSEGKILSYEDQLVYVNDFEREFLVARSSGSNAGFHATLARVLLAHFDPSTIFDFDTLTPSENPFFPDSERDTAERLLQTGFVDRLPGVTHFFALRELTFHLLSSCIGDSPRTQQQVLESAIQASHYFLLLDWLLYQYGHRVESRKMSEYLEQALEGRPDLLHAQVWLRPIRVLVDQGEVDAAQEKLKTEITRRFPKQELAPTLVLAIQMELEARILTLRARHDEAFSRHVESIHVFRKADNPKGESTAFIHSARSAHKLDRRSAAYEAAPVLALEAARLCQTPNFTNPRYAWENLLSASEMHWELGHDRRARRCILQSLHHMDLYLGRQADVETGLRERSIETARKIFDGREGSLVFDCDGVLVDTERIKFNAWQSVTRKRNIQLSHRMYYSKLVGLPVVEVVKRLQEVAEKTIGGDANSWKDVSAVRAEFTEKFNEFRALEKKDKESLLRFSQAHVINAFNKARLAKNSWWPGLRLAVVSLEDEDLLLDNLQIADIEKREDFRIQCDEDPYSQLVNDLPGPCLVVEDSAVGAQMARESGMDVILISGTPLIDGIPHLQHFELRYENGAGPYAFLAYLAGVVDRDEAFVQFPLVALTPEEKTTINCLLEDSTEKGNA